MHIYLRLHVFELRVFVIFIQPCNYTGSRIIIKEKKKCYNEFLAEAIQLASNMNSEDIFF